MLYTDDQGRILAEDDINSMEPFEIEERGIHINDDDLQIFLDSKPRED